MVLWFVGLAPLAVWSVFRDPAFDHRLVALAALVPLAIDLPLGRAWVGHSLFTSVALLVMVMLATRRRRRLRRHLLALPVGTFLHLVLDGTWTRVDAFWWPLLGVEVPDTAIGPLTRPVAALVAMELAGAGALVWLWRRFGLSDPAQRRAFLRTGRLPRSVLEPPPRTC